MCNIWSELINEVTSLTLINNFKGAYILFNNSKLLNRINKDGDTILHFLIKNELDSMASIIINHTNFNKINLRNKNNETPLILSVKKNNYFIANDLLRNINVKIFDKYELLFILSLNIPNDTLYLIKKKYYSQK